MNALLALSGPGIGATVPVSGRLRIIVDGPVLELASPAGLFSAALRPAGDDLHIRASAGALDVFSFIEDRDRG